MFQKFFKLFLLTLFITQLSHAQETENEEKILKVILKNGEEVSNSWVVYEKNSESKKKIYYPLQYLVNDLGFFIQFNTDKLTATGNILEKEYPFELNLTYHKFLVKNKEILFKSEDWMLEPGETDPAHSDWWFSGEILEKVFPIRFHYSSSQSLLKIETLMSLPLEERTLRRQKDDSFLLRGNKQKKTDSIEIHNPDFYFNAIDEQIHLKATKVNGEKRVFEKNSSSTLTGNFFGFSTLSNIDFDFKNFKSPHFNFSKDQFQFGDIVSQNIKMMNTTLFGKGFVYSTYPYERASQFSTKTFSGNLPAGWDVELYLDDLFLSRRESENNQYLFENIPLYFGLNTFKLKFYGPQGQRREEFKNYWVGASMIKPDELFYQIEGVHQSKENNRFQTQIEKGLTNELSVSGNFSVETLNQTQFFPVKIGLSHFNSVLYSKAEFLSSLQSSGNPTYATQLQTQMPLKDHTLSGTYLHLNKGFKSPYTLLTNDPNQTEKNIDYFIPSLFSFFTMNSLRVFEDTKENDQNYYGFRHRTSFSIASLQWSHSYEKAYSSYQSQSISSDKGILSTTYQKRTSSLRGEWNYGQDLRSIALEYQKRLTDELNGILRLENDFNSKIKKISSNFNQKYNQFTTTLQTSLDTKKTTSIGLIVSFSLDRNESSHFQMFPDNRALFGEAEIRFYMDNNHNQIYDSYDTPLAGVGVRVGANRAFFSNIEGIVHIPKLNPNETTLLTILEDTLQDPMLKPNVSRVTLFPKIGQQSEFEIPIAWYGEVDGKVLRLEKTGLRAVHQTKLLLTSDENQQLQFEVKTDRDGYFLFEKIPPGSYTLKLKELKSKEFKIKIPTDGGAITDQNFQL